MSALLGSISITYVIAFAILIIMVIGVFVFALTVSKNEALLRKRLDELDTMNGVDITDYTKRKKTIQDMSMSEKMLYPYMIRMSKFMINMTPKEQYEKLNLKLTLAGNPKGMTATEFLGIRGLFIFVVPVILFLFQVLLGSAFPQALLFSIVFACAGFVLPNFWLGKAVTQRKEKIQKDLPFTLDLLNVSVDAGLGFDSAMDKVSQTLDGPLSEEFGRVLSEIRLGKTRKEALRNMLDRTDVKDLSQFVVSVIQAERLGVGMSKLLRVQSKQMRQAAKQRAQEKAFKAPVKMLFPMILFIFPAIFIVLLGPAALLLPSIFGGM